MVSIAIEITFFILLLAIAISFIKKLNKIKNKIAKKEEIQTDIQEDVDKLDILALEKESKLLKQTVATRHREVHNDYE